MRWRLQVAGGVALLLWGLHMVRSGVLRAWGPQLRQWLPSGLRRWRAGPSCSTWSAT